jgi:hypothetical protein
MPQPKLTNRGMEGVCIELLENVGTPGPIPESVRHPIDASPWRSPLPQFARRRNLEPTHMGSSTGTPRFPLPQQTLNPQLPVSKSLPKAPTPPEEEAFPNSPGIGLRVVP